jgi:hypothetical protein
MINLSIAEAMRLYGELVEALHGVNGFGGNVAELYMYRFGYSLNGKALMASVDADNLRQANKSLHELLAFFSDDTHAEVRIEQRGGWVPIGEWIEGAGFDHRAHVRVSKKKEEHLVDNMLTAEERRRLRQVVP